MPKQGTERKVPNGGGKKEPFRPVTESYRRHLRNQVSAIEEALAPQFKGGGAAPIRVKVIPKAAAKSHRPTELFSDKTCPIVGAGRLGELFIKATDRGLRELGKRITSNTSQTMVKELSGIESIEAITPVSRCYGRSATELLKKSPRRGAGFMTRVRLFDMGDAPDAFEKDFRTLCEARGIELDSRGYSVGAFSAVCRNTDDIETLSRFVGVRSIAPMPVVRLIRPRSLGGAKLPDLPMRSPGRYRRAGRGGRRQRD
jgi:hypothetical protein